LEDRRGQNDEVSKGMQKTVETKVGKTRMAEAERRGKERRSRKEKGRKDRKTKKAEGRKNNRRKKSS